MKSKSITIKIQCDNAAFEDMPYEVSRILRELVIDLDHYAGFRRTVLHDINGNTCGTVKLTGF